MNQQKIDIVDSDHWSIFYVNGKKVIHVAKPNSITVNEVLKALEIPHENYRVDDQDPKDYLADLNL